MRRYVDLMAAAGIIAAIAAVLAFLWTGQDPAEQAPLLPPQGQAFLPLDSAVPATWHIKATRPINIDSDEEDEWLIIYQYEETPKGPGGPLGGVIYDPQPNRDPQNLATPVPSQPAAYIPYQLLPRHGGMGFLGQERLMVEVYDVDGDPSNTPELVIQGHSGYTFPTYLAIFQWVNKVQGYRSLIDPHYAPPGTPMIFADAGVEIEREAITQRDGTMIQGKITRVLARRSIYDPPHYARSQLARQTEYAWSANSILVPLPDESVVFAFGRPSQAQEAGLLEYAVMYPEEAVLAHYPDGQVLEIYAPQENLSLPQAPVIVRVKVKHNDAQAWETWAAIRQAPGRVRDAVVWRLEKQ